MYGQHLNLYYKISEFHALPHLVTILLCSQYYYDCNIIMFSTLLCLQYYFVCTIVYLFIVELPCIFSIEQTLIGVVIFI